MSHVSKLLTMLAVVALVGVAYAAEGKSKHPVIHGTIVSVNVEGKSFVVKTAGKESKDVTVVTDDSTKITLDKQPATLADLKAGLQVTVAPETGTATRVEARTAAEKHEGKKKAKKAE